MCDVRLQRIELDLESYDDIFTTLDTIPPDSHNLTHSEVETDSPSRVKSDAGFSARQPKRGYGDAWITPAEIRRLARY